MPDRRIFVWVLVIVLAGAQAVAADRGDTLAEARADGRADLTVIYVPATGWAYRDEDGHLTGVTVEIMRGFADHVAEHHGIDLKLEFVEEVDWSVFYGRVREASGGVFGLGNVTITGARAEELAFSPPYVHNVAVLITHADRPLADGPGQAASDLAGLRALAFADTLHEERLIGLRDRHWPDLAIDRAGSNDEIIENVAAGTHFAWIDAYNYYRAVDRGRPLVRHPAFDDPGEAFGIIMPLDNDWQDKLAEFFARDGGLVEQADYRDLLARHLGEAVAELLTR